MRFKNYLRVAFLLSSLLSLQLAAKDIGGGIEERWNASNNTWVYTNTKTGQSMSTGCVFKNGKKCREKRQKVVHLVFHGKNQGANNLTEAGLQDAGRQVKSDFQAAGRQLQSDARAVGQAAQTAAVATDKAIKDGVASTTKFVADTVDSTREALKTRKFIAKARGIDHSMSFECIGQYSGGGKFTTKECQNDYAEAMAAIKSGSKAKSLAEHRIQSDPVARTVAAGINGIKSGVTRLGHNTCRQKLERHARDFDQDYANQGLQHLVSYEDKMSYIKTELENETAADGKNYFHHCQEHFKNAVFGMQLTWVGGQDPFKAEQTSMFNGLGRLSNGKVAKFNSERKSNHRFYKDAGEVYSALSVESN